MFWLMSYSKLPAQSYSTVVFMKYKIQEQNSKNVYSIYSVVINKRTGLQQTKEIWMLNNIGSFQNSKIVIYEALFTL